MSDTKQGSTKQSPQLGVNLKRIRKARGLSILQLAKNSGLPQSTLSKVENGQMSLNYDKLLIIANAFDVPIQELFQSDEDVESQKLIMARKTIDRAHEGDEIEADHYLAKYLTKVIKNRLMIPLELAIQPIVKGAEIPMMDLVGERFAYVVKGPVDFHCEHYETVTLNTGDSLYVDASMPHAFTSANDEVTKVLTIVASDNNEYMEKARQASLKGITDVSDKIPH